MWTHMCQGTCVEFIEQRQTLIFAFTFVWDWVSLLFMAVHARVAGWQSSGNSCLCLPFVKGALRSQMFTCLWICVDSQIWIQVLTLQKSAFCHWVISPVQFVFNLKLNAISVSVWFYSLLWKWQFFYSIIFLVSFSAVLSSTRMKTLAVYVPCHILPCQECWDYRR